MGLDKAVAQGSFSGGMFRGVARHLIPENGCYDLLNYLLDDEDGSPYKRGGSEYLSAAASGTNGGAAGIWDGRTVGGDRTLVMADTSFGIASPYLLSADDSTLAAIPAEAFSADSLSVKFSENDGVVAISDNTAAGIRVGLYGGSRKTATYNTGTISVDVGSTEVTGSGTSWNANVDAGMMFEIEADTNVVESVNSDTSITLHWPYGGAADVAGSSAYAARPIALAVFQSVKQLGACAEFVAGRLCAVPIGHPNRMQFSGFAAGDEDGNGAGAPRLFYSADDDYHGFPGQILGIHALRDVAMVFTTVGLFAVRNMAFDLTDAVGNVQQTVEKIDGMVLWSQQGVQAWGNALVVPARDGVYLVDAVSRPVEISQSVQQLYRSYVQAGYRPGQGFIFRETYCLPILVFNGGVVGWLTCRLDGAEAEARFWPWTRLDGGGMRSGTVRNRADSEPIVLGGSVAEGARVADLRWFQPEAAYKNDAGGTAPSFEIESRDHPVGSGQENTVRKARLRYELVDAESDDPEFTFSYSSEDGSWTVHDVVAPEADVGSQTWLFTERGKFFRWKVSCGTAAASAVVRSFEAWARRSAKD